MKPRLSPSRGLLVALACGVVACSLGTSGLLETSADGAAPPAVPGGNDGGAQDGGGSSGGTDASVGAGSRPGNDDAAADALAEDAGAALDDAAEEGGAEDAPGPAPDGGGEPPDCDRDGDGFLAQGACGGTDCCDFDSRAHPTETDFFSTTDACGSFDYDCDGLTTAEFTTASCKLDGFSCGSDGFDTTVPSCGDSGTFDTCTYEVVTCGSDPSVKAQACR